MFNYMAVWLVGAIMIGRVIGCVSKPGVGGGGGGG